MVGVTGNTRRERAANNLGIIELLITGVGANDENPLNGITCEVPGKGFPADPTTCRSASSHLLRPVRILLVGRRLVGPRSGRTVRGQKGIGTATGGGATKLVGVPKRQ